MHASSSDEDTRPVFIILGRVWIEDGAPEIPVHILLRAADDDSAIREALNALSEDGYAEAEFDQIGALTDMPDEEPHASAYQGAMEGEVAIVTFGDGGDADWDLDEDDDEEANPFDILKDWKPKQD